jgi:single-stranded DNA-specific DHH superfamily exonuclease
MATYGHPVMLLNKTFDEETGELTWSGSGRNNPTAGVQSLQQLAQDSGYFTLAQGHDNALGLSIPDSNVDKFISYSNELLKDCDFSPVYNVDIEYYANNIDSADILELADADMIWGQEVDEPLIVVNNIAITEDKINLFGSTLKITLPNNVSAVKFKSSQEEFDKLNPGSGCAVITLIGRCMRNTGWDNGPQIIIEDYEILRKQEYYF